MSEDKIAYCVFYVGLHGYDYDLEAVFAERSVAAKYVGESKVYDIVPYYLFDKVPRDGDERQVPWNAQT